MAFDLAKIPYEPFGCVTTTIGELCVFSISSANEQELLHGTGKPIKEYESSEFIRKFIRYTCFPKTSLKESRNKPVEPLLTDKDILSLTGDELEAIAKLYIENNEYLFKKLIFKTKEDDQGQTVHYPEYGEVEYPKNDKENYTQYLLRLHIKKEEKQKKQMDRMFSGINSFSEGLGTSIKNTLSVGDSLRKTMESIRPVNIANIMPTEFRPRSPLTDILMIERMKEERRLKPFNDLTDRLDQLIDASAQAAEFMIEANQIQTRIAGEIKSSSDETTKLSLKNINLTYIVIIIAAFSIIVSMVTIFRSNSDGNMQRLQTRENVNLLAGKLTEINNSISGANDSLRIENEHLKEQTAKQANMIDEMKIMIEGQGRRLQDMEKKLLQKDQKK